MGQIRVGSIFWTFRADSLTTLCSTLGQDATVASAWRRSGPPPGVTMPDAAGHVCFVLEKDPWHPWWLCANAPISCLPLREGNGIHIFDIQSRFAYDAAKSVVNPGVEAPRL